MRQPPRVLHVLRRDHAGHVGGDLVQLEAMVSGLQRRGVDAIAATVEAAPTDVDVVHLYNLQRPLALLGDVRRARRRWPRAHVVLSPVWWPWRLRTMARSGDRAIVVMAVKRGIKQTALWPAERHLLRSLDVVLPNSRAEVDALRRWYRLGRGDDGRWAVIPNGVHLSQWPVRRADAGERRATMAELGIDPDGAPIVASVARVEPIKNQRKIVEAIQELPAARLLLIGPDDDPYAASVRDAAAQLHGRVAFTGRLTPAQVRAMLAAVDVHVLASFRETPGLATLEAAATGCAVVVTAEGSALEYLGDAAHVADPADASSIARAIAAAAADPRQPDARHRVETFDWDRAIDALLAAYQRLPRWPVTRS